MARHKGKWLQPGTTISEGTLVEKDLIGAYLSALETVTLARDERKTFNAVKWRHEHDVSDEYDLEDLQNIADSHVPPFCGIGSHEGDGALIGVWVDHQQIDDALMEDTMCKGEDLPSRMHNNRPLETEDDFEWWLQVNDHGNATLWRRKARNYGWVKVWEVV